MKHSDKIQLIRECIRKTGLSDQKFAEHESIEWFQFQNWMYDGVHIPELLVIGLCTKYSV